MNDSQAVINWYPGHMAKAKRQLQDQIRSIDLIIEMCDARLPFSSRNPELISMANGKSHILFINKSDLADTSMNQRWLRCFQDQNTDAYLINAARINGKEIISLIRKATQDIVDKALVKGVRKTVRVMIVGVPNVGKSTLINRISGRSVMQIGDRPGVTRNNQWVRVSPYLDLLDTPGLLWPRLDDQTAARRLCYIGTIRDDITDMADLTIHLLEDLCAVVPENIAERYHLKDTSLTGIGLLDEVCRGRGWILKGAQPDYDRCCSIVLDEFRAGKLGRITLEIPDDFSAKEIGRND